ncbi:hypothetical protein, unlikely [Trypanosoma brucei brucei TREU927]|uniref:Uncharacterized protein n=1 Tax=Trypanosoma brucei brucei (strain 927/4 GUTat10.1) TaxID=185431 RepID=Q38G49_TRYB2|nr:hypothetical protein, unlikely [Trypanosoma brucei brucei TREU927]EAN76221.1 hypothetical protein, unlikely [Trypanosoma brucei brucei TREU927]
MSTHFTRHYLPLLTYPAVGKTCKCFTAILICPSSASVLIALKRHQIKHNLRKNIFLCTKIFSNKIFGAIGSFSLISIFRPVLLNCFTLSFYSLFFIFFACCRFFC